MSDSKVFMFPDCGQNSANSLLPLMAMGGNGGVGGGAWNNPFIYLVWMMFAQRMWGRNGFGGQDGQDLEIQSQLSGIREQLNTN